MRRVREVGSGLGTPHGTGGAVVSAGGFLSGVVGAEPPPLLRLRVTYLRRVPPPRPPPYPPVPRSRGGSGGSPIGGGGGGGGGSGGGGSSCGLGLAVVLLLNSSLSHDLIRRGGEVVREDCIQVVFHGFFHYFSLLEFSLPRRRRRTGQWWCDMMVKDVPIPNGVVNMRAYL